MRLVFMHLLILVLDFFDDYETSISTSLGNHFYNDQADDDEYDRAPIYHDFGHNVVDLTTSYGNHVLNDHGTTEEVVEENVLEHICVVSWIREISLTPRTHVTERLHNNLFQSTYNSGAKVGFSFIDAISFVFVSKHGAMYWDD